MDFEALRRHFRPDHFSIVFVGESPPAGGTFFYAGNSNLYDHTETAFRAALGRRIGPDFLHSFADLGCYLDDLCLKPVNHLSLTIPTEAKMRKQARREGEAPLAVRLEGYRPRLMVGIGSTIGRHFVRAHHAAGLDRDELRIVKFPNYPDQRDDYVADVTRILKEALAGGLFDSG